MASSNVQKGVAEPIRPYITKINKLGGSSWNSIKLKAKKALKKIAIDIVRLYAERIKQPMPQGDWDGVERKKTK